MMRLLRSLALLAAGLAAGRRPRRPTAAPAPSEVPPPPRSRWSHRFRIIGAFVGMLVLLGLLVAATGLIPVKASTGHFAVTRWFLDWSKARSVSTHSAGIHPPPRDSLLHPSLVLRGAGHYETGCRPCHGIPTMPRPRIAREMTAEPPSLSTQIEAFEDEELFYIVMHGIKFTGMPAWPARERDDEVWAMVGFLRTLPTLDAADYRRLVRGDAPASLDAEPLADLLGPQGTPRALTTSCARCHGLDGAGRGAGAFPKLAGQRYEYLYAALRAYAVGSRNSGIMEPIAGGLTDDELRALARHYAALPPPAPEAAPADAIERGRTLAENGLPAQGVPPCAACHGPGAGPRNPHFPDLAGQYADYLVLQLTLFAEERRGGSPYAPLMHPAATGLTAEQRRDVAAFYAALPPMAKSQNP